MVLSIQQRVTIPPIAAVNADTKTSAASSVQEQVAVRSNVAANSQKMHLDLQKSLEQLNQVMKDSGRNLSFSMDQALGRPVVVVRKEDTGEVIRQIPNEAIVSVAHNIELLKGILLNRRT
ncbi:MAG: flagellar protein FlaG [Burkholderiaceae bacterium]